MKHTFRNIFGGASRQTASRLLLGALLVTIAMLSLSTPSSAQIGIGISVRVGPPALPIYEQPLCPGAGYLWTPGYWAWNDDGGYYWVPGTWVVGPVGLLWTPGYWGFAGGLYGWHGGYWGPHIGFYGGVNYGFGYGGVGFAGGEWRNGAFFYNRSVMNVNVTEIHNVYNKTVIVNNVHTSFNGPGGVEARPTAEEERYSHEQHTPPIAAQTQHEHEASQNKALFASENHGRPAIAATAKPGEFSGRGVVAAHAAGAAYHEPKMSPKEARAEDGNRGGKMNRNEGREKNANAERENNRNEARENNRNAERQANQAKQNREMREENRPENRGANREPSHENAGHNAKPAEHQQAPKQAPKPAKPEHAAKPEHNNNKEERK